jgi:fatty acyl-CoA reductase
MLSLQVSPIAEMVEVLLDRVDGQEVAIVESDCIPEPSTECTPTERTSTESPPLINEKLTPIQEFYYGQSIFLTGGTGFMGKLLIEKLLRTCPGVVSIYLLVRPKKGKDVHQRTEEIFDDPVSA